MADGAAKRNAAMPKDTEPGPKTRTRRKLCPRWFNDETCQPGRVGDSRAYWLPDPLPPGGRADAAARQGGKGHGGADPGLPASDDWWRAGGRTTWANSASQRTGRTVRRRTLVRVLVGAGRPTRPHLRPCARTRAVLVAATGCSGLLPP